MSQSQTREKHSNIQKEKLIAQNIHFKTNIPRNMKEANKILNPGALIDQKL